MKASTRYFAYLVIMLFVLFAGLYKRQGWGDIWWMALIFVGIFVGTEIITYFVIKQRKK